MSLTFRWDICITAIINNIKVNFDCGLFEQTNTCGYSTVVVDVEKCLLESKETSCTVLKKRFWTDRLPAVGWWSQSSTIVHVCML